MTSPLSYTVPDTHLIDALRGFVAVAGVILLVAAPIAWWRMRHLIPTRVRGLFVVLIGSTVYIAATEAQQIGRPFLVWRLPIGFAVIIGALVYVFRLAVAVDHDEPVR